MKKKYQLILGILVAAILLFSTSCEETSASPNCKQGGDIIHTVNEVEGGITYNADLEAWVVTYFVPGTIDSAWSGVICNESFPDFAPQENQRVNFSGNFRDDRNELQPNVVFGGQEFFYLEVTFIELVT